MLAVCACLPGRIRQLWVPETDISNPATKSGGSGCTLHRSILEGVRDASMSASYTPHVQMILQQAGCKVTLSSCLPFSWILTGGLLVMKSAS